MRFEWDPEKDRSNARKHQGIDFSTAALVFADPISYYRKTVSSTANGAGMQLEPHGKLYSW